MGNAHPTSLRFFTECRSRFIAEKMQSREEASHGDFADLAVVDDDGDLVAFVIDNGLLLTRRVDGAGRPRVNFDGSIVHVDDPGDRDVRPGISDQCGAVFTERAVGHFDHEG